MAVAFALRKATQTFGFQEFALTAVALVTVVVSWLVVNTVFSATATRTSTTRCLREEASTSPDGPPDYADFAYLSFTIGMTYQVSDTGLQTSGSSGGRCCATPC